MKKLVTLLVAMVMVMAMGMTALADGEPIDVMNPMMAPTSVELEAGESATYNFASNFFGGKVLTVLGEGVAVTVDGVAATAVEGGVSITFAPSAMTMSVVITNNSTATQNYVVKILDAVGSFNNPDAIESMLNAGEYTVEIPASYAEYGPAVYFYTYVAEANGTLSFSVKSAGNMFDAPMNVDIEVQVAGSNDVVASSTLSENGVSGVLSVDVKKGNKVTIIVSECDEYDAGVPGATIVWNSSFVRLGSVEMPIFVEYANDMTSVEVPAGSETCYTISSYLYGQILTIEAAEGVTVTVNGGAVTAANGEYSIVLAGGPTASVVVTNAGTTDVELLAEINWPLGSESNPIRVNNASDLTSVEVEAGAEVYYSISSFLYGQVLTVEAAEGVEVSLNGTKLTAVDGEYVVVLTGGPSASLVVKNAGETAAELAANINWPLGSESTPSE